MNDTLEVQVFLTKPQMEAVANGIAGFYNLTFKEKIKVSPEQTALIINVMEKFKQASAYVDSGIIV